MNVDLGRIPLVVGDDSSIVYTEGGLRVEGVFRVELVAIEDGRAKLVVHRPGLPTPVTLEVGDSVSGNWSIEFDDDRLGLM